MNNLKDIIERLKVLGMVERTEREELIPIAEEMFEEKLNNSNIKPYANFKGRFYVMAHYIWNEFHVSYANEYDHVEFEVPFDDAVDVLRYGRYKLMSYIDEIKSDKSVDNVSLDYAF